MQASNDIIGKSGARNSCCAVAEFRALRFAREIMKTRLGLSIPVIIGLLALWHGGCDSPTGSPPNRQVVDTLDFVETPTDDFEAETAAYLIAGTRLAPKYWFNKIQTELKLIRSQHDTVAGVAVTHKPWAYPSDLTLRFSPSVMDSVMAGEYHAWDSLNELCVLETYDSAWGYVLLDFAGWQNPIALFEMYRHLPGLWHIETSAVPGDWPVLVMRREGGSIKYFFREAWGDCFVGCTHSRYSYFTVGDSIASYHGSFQSDDTTTPAPVWADTAWQTLHDYHQYASWTSDSVQPHIDPCDSITSNLPVVGEYPGNDEARLAAICVWPGLNPHLPLYSQIKDDLAWIRQNRPESAEAVDSIRFRSPWNPRGFLASWNPDEMNDTAGTSYRLFTCLKEHFGVPWVEEGGSWWHLVHGGGNSVPVHPCALIEEFKVVPAIQRMRPQMRPDIESDIFVARNRDSIHYFFRHAYGPILTTPDLHYENEEFFYFRRVYDVLGYVGKYDPQDGPAPNWFANCQETRANKYALTCDWIRTK